MDSGFLLDVKWMGVFIDSPGFIAIVPDGASVTFASMKSLLSVLVKI